MALRKHVMLTVVLLGISGLLLGCSSDDIVTPITATEAPLIAPSNVTATRTANGDVEIAWDPISQPHLEGYHVYRYAFQAQRIERLTAVPIDVNHYVDTDAGSMVRYEYRVTAVHNKNRETGYSPVMVLPVQHTGGRDDGEGDIAD